MRKGETYYCFGNTVRIFRISSLAQSWCIVQFFDIRKNYVDYFGTEALPTTYLKKNTRKVSRRFWYKVIRYLNEDRRNIFG